MKKAKLLIASSEKDANLFYASRFLAPDPFVLLILEGRKIALIGDLEIDRAKKASSIDEVFSFSELSKKAKVRLGHDPRFIEVVDDFLKGYGVGGLDVPLNFAFGYAQELSSLGYQLQSCADSFFPERAIKSDEELGAITSTLRTTEKVLSDAIGLICQSDADKSGQLSLKGEVLSSQRLRSFINISLMEAGCVAQHTIVTCSKAGVDPHNEGSGPLMANEPIIIDVFPQNMASRYFADITRTVVKGKASDKVRRMFEAVRQAQEIAFGDLRDGCEASAIHKKILSYFDSLGFKTGSQDGRMQGFFHGTGHGVGLEIHEPPRIGEKQDVLRSGMVLTVEPGLYYADVGGMRIEDMVVITKQGCKNLTEAPKVLEV